MPIDQRKAILGEMGVVFPIGPVQPMLDVGSAFGFAQRAQMVSSGYPLPQLLEPGDPEDRAELRLTEEKALERHGPVEDDVGQQPQLFERVERQVLSLFDDQKNALAVTRLR